MVFDNKYYYVYSLLMEYFSVVGGKKLIGEIEVFGSKNSALPILAACLLSKGRSVIKNLPQINDIFVLIDILKSLGVEVNKQGERIFSFDCKNIDENKIDNHLVRKLRGSILFLGPLLARFGKIELSYPGGCSIGARSLNSHFEGFKSLGAKVEEQNDKFIVDLKNYKGGEVVLPEFSVTATENILIFASYFKHKTVIKMAAAEPSVIELAVYLRKLGANIKGEGTHTIIINGGINDKEVEHVIWTDSIEAGSFIALGSVKADLKILNVPINFLDMVFLRFKEIGVELNFENIRTLNGEDKIADVIVKSAGRLKATKIQTLPYPGFPTDLQPIFCSLATQCEGMTVIQDYLYEGRFRYVDELKKMGANANIIDTHRVFVVGPTPLYGRELSALDLRSGMALICAALMAEGKSMINDIYSIDRGYEKIEERLKKIGADIKRFVKKSEPKDKLFFLKQNS